MKAMVVLILIILAAVSVVAYGHADMAGMAAMVSHSPQTDEPMALLLSGSALIGLAGALRRVSL